MVTTGYEVRDTDGTVLATADDATWTGRAVAAANRAGHEVQVYEGAELAFRVYPGARLERVRPQRHDAEAEDVARVEAVVTVARTKTARRPAAARVASTGKRSPSKR